MSGHPQSSPRGFFAKQKVAVGGNELTASGTTVVFPAAIKISNAQEISGNATGIFFNDTVGSLPANVTTGIHFGVMVNSTGTAPFVNLGGTTNRFINVTATQPTT